MTAPDAHFSIAERVSYAPGQLLLRPQGPDSAALLFADIAGFTPLASRLGERGARGAEDLSRVLDAFFGELLALVVAHGGEPVKFAGDALFALWPADEHGLDDATRRAAACALALQANLGNYDAGAAVRLEIRVALASGAVATTEVEAGDARHFVVAGPVMQQLARAAPQAQAGQVVLSAQAWDRVAQTARGVDVGQGCRRIESLRGPAAAARAPLDLGPHDAARVAAYVPAPIRARIEAGHGGWLAELRRVTVLFVQVQGLDPADAGAAERLRDIAARAHRVLTRYGGFLKEVAVDEKGLVLVGLYGVPPQGHEDDPARALRSAIELQAVLGEAGLACGIGVTTGRCFCGVCGSDVHREYAVIGEVMNLAARLMSVAAAGGGASAILCDASTSRLAAARVVCEPQPALRLRGRPDPVEVYRPVTLSERAALAGGGQLIGRLHERAAIAAAVEALQRPGGGPATLLFVGDAGLGKSRLAEELAAAALRASLAVHQGYADAIEAATPYGVWRRVFESLLGVEGLADRAARRAEVERRLGADLWPSAPLLEALVPLGLADTAQTAELSGAARAAATQRLCLTLLARAAAAQASVVVLEDGHWFDAASWSLVLEACRKVDRLLVAVTTRPLRPFAPPELAALQGEARCRVLELGPLEPAQTLALAAHCLGAARLAEPIAEMIESRAAGHPFFAAELAYALRDAGVVEVEGGLCRAARGVDLAALSLPTTLEGVVTGRIDQLAPPEQLALKVASVIGSSFPEALLHDVHPVPQDRPHLHAHLESLVRVDLTVEEEPAPATAYAFKHVITRDVAYELMLYAQRSRLHRAVAERYERDYADDRPELLAVLAHHWAHAGVVDKAVAYLEKAAVRTFSLGLGRSAVVQGLEAARLLGVALPTAPADIVPLLGAELGRIQSLLGGRSAQDLLDLEPSSDANADAVIGLLLRIMPFAHQSQQAELFALMALRCMSLTLQRGRGPAAPLVYAMYSIVYRAMTGDIAAGYRYARLALELDERCGGAQHGAVSFVYTWFNQHWLHPLARGLEMSRLAAERAFAAGDVLYGCFNLSAHVVYLAASGQPLERVMAVSAEHLARNGARVRNAAFHCAHELQFAKAMAGLTVHRLSLSDAAHDEERDIASICATDHYNQIGFYFVSRLRLHYHAGDHAAALEYAGKALACLPAFAGQVAEVELWLFHALALLARAAQRREGPQAALPLIERLQAWNELCPENFAHKLDLARAERWRVEGDLDAAQAHYRAAADQAARAGYLQYEALAHELHGAALHEAGRSGWQQAARAARDAYLRWGAHAKVRDLDARYFGA